MRLTCFLMLVALLVGCNKNPETTFLSLDELLKTPQFEGYVVQVEPSYQNEPTDKGGKPVPLSGPYKIVPKTKFEIGRNTLPFRYRFEFDDKHYYVSFEDAPGWGIRSFLLRNDKGEVGAILLKTKEKVEAPQRPQAQAPQRTAAQVKAAIMQQDADGDGKISESEMSDRLKGRLEEYDANKDGAFDSDEIDKMLEERMGGDNQTSRPPADDSDDDKKDDSDK